MPHVFLSYSREDEAEAKQIADALGETGLEVWWDRTIPPGKTFDRVIEEALDDASWALVLWSTTSIESNWVKAEADEALRRGILVPVLIDHVRPPLAFRRIEAAELQDWDGDATNPEFANLLKVMGSDAPPPPKARSAPPTQRSTTPPSEARSSTARPAPTDEPATEPFPPPAGMGTAAKGAIGVAIALVVVLAVVFGMRLGRGSSPGKGEVGTPTGRPAADLEETSDAGRRELQPQREIESPPDDEERQTQTDARRRTRPQATPVAPAPSGTITLRYAGDAYNCILDLKITVAGQTVVPQSNIVSLRGVPLGPADYGVRGVISCPTVGACNAEGSGRIRVVDGGLYDLVWQNTTYAHCQVSFVKSG